MPSAEIAALKPIKSWSPKHFHTRHQLMCKFHACGLTNKEIADAMGVTQARVSIILNDPRAAEYIRNMVADVGDKFLDLHLSINALAPRALKVVEDIMSNEEAPAGVRSRNAFELLDRAGYGKVEKHLHLGAQLSDKQVEQLARARENRPEPERLRYVVEAD